VRRRTLLALLGGGSLAGSLTLGSGAFTEETATRQTSVAVVGDSDAYLTLEYQDTVSFECSTEVDVTVRNRTGHDELNIDISLSADNSISVDPDSKKLGPLDDGGEVTLTVDIDADDGAGGAASLDFDVTASGGSIAIEAKERTVTLDCSCPATTG
jgi:hypothetical protein